MGFFDGSDPHISLEQASLLKTESQAGTLTAAVLTGILAPTEADTAIPEESMDVNTDEGKIQQVEKPAKNQANPYKGMLKSLNHFFKQLPYDNPEADPGE